MPKEKEISNDVSTVFDVQLPEFIKILNQLYNIT